MKIQDVLEQPLSVWDRVRLCGKKEGRNSAHNTKLIIKVGATQTTHLTDGQLRGAGNSELHGTEESIYIASEIKE